MKPTPTQAKQLNTIARYLLESGQTRGQCNYYIDAAVIINGYVNGLPRMLLGEAEALIQCMDYYATEWAIFEKKQIDVNSYIYLSNNRTYTFITQGGIPQLCQPVNVRSEWHKFARC